MTLAELDCSKVILIFLSTTSASHFEALTSKHKLAKSQAKTTHQVAKRYAVPFCDSSYNSKAYWQFRKDLLEGNADPICGGCRYNKFADDVSFKDIAISRKNSNKKQDAPAIVEQSATSI